MMIERGFRDKLDKYINPAEDIAIDLSISGPAVYDFSCFGVDSAGKLSDERYMIFYNQTESPEKAITYTENSDSSARFCVNLGKVPYEIKKLVFTASIDGSGTMSDITSHSMILTQGGKEAFTMTFGGQDFRSERAIITIEIYHKDSSWRIAAVVSGFNGGLSELLMYYGGTEANGSDANTTHVISSESVSSSSLSSSTSPENNHEEKHESSAAGQNPESIPVAGSRRVELRKGQKVRLEKKHSAAGEILINLNWKNAAKNSGLFAIRKADKAKSIDLDIGCLYELSDGKRGSIQALGSKFGSLNQPPYIALDKDDRTGDALDGENLRINITKIPNIKRILVYTFIYEGVNNWQEADGVVTIKCPGSGEVIIRLDEYDTDRIMCALAMLENVNNETFSVEKIIKFFDGHISLDNAYQWGLRWVHGTKALHIPSA